MSVSPNVCKSKKKQKPTKPGNSNKRCQELLLPIHHLGLLFYTHRGGNMGMKTGGILRFLGTLRLSDDWPVPP